MKNISISIITILLIAGCGFEKKDLNDIPLLNDNQKVDYNADGGSYDLSEYLFPNQNQTNIYQVIVYKDNQGDKRYNEPFSVNPSEPIEYSIYENSVKEGNDINYTINDFSIKKIRLVDEFYDIRDYRRFVDINDTYYSYEHIDNATTLYQVGWLTCSIREHNETTKILDKKYNDVITLLCRSASIEGVKGEFSDNKNFNTTFLFAKNIGKIGVYGEECSTKQYNSIYKSCKKTIKELKNILKEN